MGRPATDADILLPFEAENLKGDYRNFYKVKRTNLFATIQRLPSLWAGFQHLDEIWRREIEDLESLVDPKQLVPGILFIHAFMKCRIARELAFSCCIAEAWGVLRVGIESVAFAHKIHRSPTMAEVWLSKDDGKAEKQAFKKAFEDCKRTSLFSGTAALVELYHHWQLSSDYGSHTSVSTISTRFRQTETKEAIGWNLEFFDIDETRVVTALYSLLHAAHHMELVFHDVFKTRFDLDPTLVKMRRNYSGRHRSLAREIMSRYRVDIASKLAAGTN
jgi:hypothetical protein